MRLNQLQKACVVLILATCISLVSGGNIRQADRSVDKYKDDVSVDDILKAQKEISEGRVDNKGNEFAHWSWITRAGMGSRLLRNYLTLHKQQHVEDPPKWEVRSTLKQSIVVHAGKGIFGKKQLKAAWEAILNYFTSKYAIEKQSIQFIGTTGKADDVNGLTISYQITLLKSKERALRWQMEQWSLADSKEGYAFASSINKAISATIVVYKPTKIRIDFNTPVEDAPEAAAGVETETETEAETGAETGVDLFEPTQCKLISNGESTYYGTISDGFTASEVHQAAKRLISLLGFAGGFLAPDVSNELKSCTDEYLADLVEQFLPRCDEQCKPLKQCKSSCERLRSKCVPKSLQGYFPMLKKGGAWRPMMSTVGLTEGSSDVKLIEAWLSKLENCESNDVSSSLSNCLSSTYTGAACDPSKAASIAEEGNGAETGAEEGSDTESEQGTDSEVDEGAETDAGSDATQGGETVAEAVAGTVAEEGAETGAEEESDTESEQGTDSEVDEGADTGADTDAGQGTSSAADEAAETGAETGAETETEEGDETGAKTEANTEAEQPEVFADGVIYGDEEDDQDSQCTEILDKNGNPYYGTVAEGFTIEDINTSADTLVKLLTFARLKFSGTTKQQIDKCLDDYKADFLHQFLPRCDESCQPMKQCKSTCTTLKSQCIPPWIGREIKRIMPGGMMRSVVESFVGDDGLGKLRAIDAWLEKLESCDSHYLTSSETCLSYKYSGAPCDPETAEEKAIEPLAKCEGFNDINGFKLIAHNVGHLAGTSALVKHGTEGNDYVNTLCSPTDAMSCVNSNFINYKDLKGAIIMEQIKLMDQEETITREYVWDRDTFAGKPTPVKSKDSSDAELMLWLGDTEGPGFQPIGSFDACDDGSMFPSKVGSEDIFFAWRSQRLCSNGDGLFGALGRFPECMGCSTNEKDYGKFDLGMMHDGKETRVEYSNLWVKGGHCTENKGIVKPFSGIDGVFVDSPKYTNMKLTTREYDLVDFWQTLVSNPPEVSAQEIEGWSDSKIRSRIDELIGSARQFVRKDLANLLVSLKGKVAMFEGASKVLDIIYACAEAIQGLTANDDNIDEVKKEIEDMDEETTLMFVASLDGESKFKLLEVAKETSTIRQKLIKLGHFRDILKPLRIMQKVQDFENLKADLQKVIVTNVEDALGENGAFVASQGHMSSKNIMATMKTFDSQTLENIYEDVKNQSTSAAYTFKQLQLKVPTCSRYQNIPMCNSDLFQASSTSTLLPDSHAEMEVVFKKLEKAFTGTKFFFQDKMSSKCLRLWKKSTCNALLPKCNLKCEAQTPCKSTCDELAEECKMIFTPLSLSVFKHGGYMHSIISKIMGDDMNIFQHVIDISRRCNDDMYNHGEEQDSCSSLISPSAVQCNNAEESNVEQSSILLSKDISIIEKLAAKRRRAAEMEDNAAEKKEAQDNDETEDNKAETGSEERAETGSEAESETVGETGVDIGGSETGVELGAELGAETGSETGAETGAKCQKIRLEDFSICGKVSYMGTSTLGYSVDDVKESFNMIFNKALPMAQMFLNIPSSCIPAIQNETCSLFFPSCSIDCKARKSCRSTCKGALKECDPLSASLPLISKNGPYEPFIKNFFGKNEKTWKIAQQIIGHLNCEGDHYSDESTCATIRQNEVACQYSA